MHTLDVSDVKPAEFSEVWRPLCGPGFGFVPFAKAFRICLVLSGVRSSYRGGQKAGTTRKSLTHVEIIANNDHGSVTASTLAFDLNHGELSVLGGFAGMYSAQVTTDRIQDFRGPSQHARRSGADLYKVFADGFPGALSKFLHAGRRPRQRTC